MSILNSSYTIQFIAAKYRFRNPLVMPYSILNYRIKKTQMVDSNGVEYLLAEDTETHQSFTLKRQLPTTELQQLKPASSLEKPSTIQLSEKLRLQAKIVRIIDCNFVPKCLKKLKAPDCVYYVYQCHPETKLQTFLNNFKPPFQKRVQLCVTVSKQLSKVSAKKVALTQFGSDNILLDENSQPIFVGLFNFTISHQRSKKSYTENQKDPQKDLQKNPDKECQVKLLKEILGEPQGTENSFTKFHLEIIKFLDSGKLSKALQIMGFCLKKILHEEETTQCPDSPGYFEEIKDLSNHHRQNYIARSTNQLSRSNQSPQLLRRAKISLSPSKENIKRNDSPVKSQQFDLCWHEIILHRNLIQLILSCLSISQQRSAHKLTLLLIHKCELIAALQAKKLKKMVLVERNHSLNFISSQFFTSIDMLTQETLKLQRVFDSTKRQLQQIVQNQRTETLIEATISKQFNLEDLLCVQIYRFLKQELQRQRLLSENSYFLQPNSHFYFYLSAKIKYSTFEKFLQKKTSKTVKDIWSENYFLKFKSSEIPQSSLFHEIELRVQKYQLLNAEVINQIVCQEQQILRE